MCARSFNVGDSVERLDFIRRMHLDLNMFAQCFLEWTWPDFWADIPSSLAHLIKLRSISVRAFVDLNNKQLLRLFFVS